MDDQTTEYFYSIVDQLPLQPGADEDDRDEVELMSFVGREDKTELFEQALVIVRDQIDPKEWRAVARRLKCRLYRDGETIFTCFVSEDGHREGDDGGGMEAFMDDEAIVAAAAAKSLSPEYNQLLSEVQAGQRDTPPEPKKQAHGFTKDELPALYQDLNLLFTESDTEADAELVLHKCNEVVADHESEVRAWILGSKALQRLDQAEDALAYVKTALILEPSNLDAHLQLFMVLIQLGRTDEIAIRINAAFPKLASRDHLAFAGFVAEAIKTDLVKRIELSVDVATAVLRARNSKG